MKKQTNLIILGVIFIMLLAANYMLGATTVPSPQPNAMIKKANFSVVVLPNEYRPPPSGGAGGNGTG